MEDSPQKTCSKSLCLHVRVILSDLVPVVDMTIKLTRFNRTALLSDDVVFGDKKHFIVANGAVYLFCCFSMVCSYTAKMQSDLHCRRDNLSSVLVSVDSADVMPSQ